MEAYNDIRAQKLGLVEFKSTDSELFEEPYINLKNKKQTTISFIEISKTSIPAET